MSLRPPEQQGQNIGSLDILGEVELASFSAEPAMIGAFGASVLTWAVTGPSGFQLELNSRPVSKSGEQVVLPSATTTYRLTATAGRFSRTLDSVEVAVDRSVCEINSLVNPRSTIQAPTTAAIMSSSLLYFRDGSLPNVTFSPGVIRLQLQLAARIPWFPDPDVNIDASFGLAVHDGALEAVGEQISVDVSVPFWVWAIPGAIPGLAIALDGGRATAYREMHNGILGLVDLLNFYCTPPKGFRLISVRVDDGNNGAGIIETTQCRDDLLRKFAEVSQVTVIK